MNANRPLPAAPAPRETRRQVIASGAAVVAAPALAPLAAVSPLDGLEAALRRQLVGQDGAVAAVAGALRRLRPTPFAPQRFRASFLFLGPTGVGKTMLARSLAQHLYGDPDALVNATPGAPEGAPLSGAGEAEDGAGAPVRRRRRPRPARPGRSSWSPQPPQRHNSVLVLSSGASTPGAWSPPGGPAMKAALLERIDQVVLFRPLEWPQRRLLVQRMLEGTRADVLSRGVRLEVDGAALDWLAGAGFDPAAGARPLRRLLQQEVQSPLERLAQAGETPPGSRVRIGAGGPGAAGLRIEVERPLRPERSRSGQR